MLKRILIALIVMAGLTGNSFAILQTVVPVAPPKTAATTPAGCLQEVRDYVAKRQQEMMAATAPPANQPRTAEANLQLNQQRASLVSQINQARTAMARECAARFDAKSVPDKDLVTLAELYTDAGQQDMAKASVERALTVKTFTPA